MGVKHEMGRFLTIDLLDEIYNERGMAHVATDGRYVQIVNEKDSKGLQFPRSQ